MNLSSICPVGYESCDGPAVMCCPNLLLIVFACAIILCLFIGIINKLREKETKECVLPQSNEQGDGK